MNKSERNAIDQIIEEGNIIEGFIGSDAWRIVHRTARALVDNYRRDSYDAAKDETKSVRNFLGRMEGIEELLRIIETDFIEARTRALDEKRSRQQATDEARAIDAATADALGTPMLNRPATL